MDIRIECLAGDPPTWKVFLGTFFWSCSSKEEAEVWASNADTYMLSNSPSCQLPSPPPPPNRPELLAGRLSRCSYIEDESDVSAQMLVSL